MADLFSTYNFLIGLIGINAILALSIYITLSCAMLSLSNAASMAIGGYTAALLTTQAGWALWPAVIVGALVAGFVALLLGLSILRLRGVFLAIATIGFGEVVRIVIINTDAMGGAQGLRLNTSDATASAGLPEIYGALLVIAYLFWRLRGSRVGLALEAIREDESAARTTGINVNFYKVAAYVAGAVLAGLGGGLYAHLRAILLPGDFGFGRAVDILVFAVVGGTFAWPGALLGALLMTILSEVLRAIPPIGDLNIKDYPEIFSGLILLLVILFLPNGLLSMALSTGRSAGRRRPPPAQVAADPQSYQLDGAVRGIDAVPDRGDAAEDSRQSGEATHTGAGPREAAP